MWCLRIERRMMLGNIELVHLQLTCTVGYSGIGKKRTPYYAGSVYSSPHDEVRLL